MEQRKINRELVNRPPKDIRLNDMVRARVRKDQKEFVKSQADQFAKSESAIVRFSLDAIRGIFPPDFFPSKEELDETKKDVLALSNILADIRRTVKKAGVNENQIAKAVNSGRAPELLDEKYYDLLKETRELMEACRDLYWLLEPNMEYVFERKPEWL